MTLITYIERMKFVDNLIRRKATGTPRLLAKKLNLSRSQTMNFLREMKDLGFPIDYSRRINSYYYTIEIKLSFNLFEPVSTTKNGKKDLLPEEELGEASGGRGFLNFLFRPIILDGTKRALPENHLLWQNHFTLT